MAAFYLFIISLMVLCFAMYVYDNERNMMTFKLECIENIKELNKTDNLFKKDFAIVRQEIEDVSIRLNKSIETITALEEATKKDFMQNIKDVTIKLNNAVKTISTLEETSKKERTMTCRDGWIMRELRCYIFIKTPKTWEKAADDCTSKQAKLIKVSDSDKNSWVGSQMKGHTISVLWIGLNDRLLEGDYVWHGDLSKLTFRNWDRGQPDNSKGLEDCIVIWGGTYWNDAPCVNTHSYACEKNPIVL